MKFYNIFYTLCAWGIAMVLLLGSATTNLQAQCSYLGSQYLSSAAPTVSGQQVLLTTCLFGGEYREVTNLIAGNTYRFETCGDTDFDTQITIFPAGGGTAVAFNDDFCGVQSSVDFTPTVTGTYDVQVNRYNCTTESTCMSLWATLVSGAACDMNEVVVDMSDSFGDGWNGNVLEIRDENDVVVGTATIPAGSLGSETFCLPDGCYSVDVDGGAFQSEVSWDISVNGNLELSGGAPESGLELAVNTLCDDPPPSCDMNEVVVDMADSFGDGWNGNVLEIFDENGNLVGDATLLTGSSGTETFCLPDGCYTVDVDGGSFDSEVSWDILVNGNIELSGGAPESGLELAVNTLCDDPPPSCDMNEVVVDMADSFGDGWNGNVLDIVDANGNIVASATITSGYGGTETFCLPDGCYNVNVDGGSFDSEVSWDILVNGNLELSGGAPESGLELDINGNCDNGGGPTCSDGMMNGDEEGVDCGGSICPPCDGPPADGDLPYPWMGDDVGADCNDWGYDDMTGFFSTIGCANNAVPGTTNDNVSYIHQTLCGDGEIVAKIESVSPGGYGGLMIRETTAAGAKMAAVFSDGGPLLRWEYRSFDNAPKTVQSFFKPNPFWLKLVRQGDWVFGYYSSNGMMYQPITASYVPMGYCVEYGLAGFSFIVGQDATANYSNVAVDGGDPLPTAETPGETIESADLKTAASLYPNPANEMVTIEFAPHQTQPTVISLRNSMGQLVEQRQLEPMSFRTEWAIENLTSGVYMIEINRAGEAAEVLRFVKSN